MTDYSYEPKRAEMLSWYSNAMIARRDRVMTAEQTMKLYHTMEKARAIYHKTYNSSIIGDLFKN